MPAVPMAVPEVVGVFTFIIYFVRVSNIGRNKIAPADEAAKVS